MEIERLGLEKCLKIELGKVNILLDNFGINYFSDYNFKSNYPIIETNGKYFIIGSKENNKIVEDLENNGVEVYPLFVKIREKINEIITEYLDECYMKNKNVETFYEDNLNRWHFSKYGKCPLMDIYQRTRYNFNLDNLEQGIIEICDYGKKCFYNLINDKMYIDDEYTNLEEQKRKIGRNFLLESDIIDYILYRKYINNELQGEELGYKEIADLNKWFNDKKMVTMVYEKEKSTEIIEKKVKADIWDLFNDLPKRYYKEMVSVYGLDNIKQIKYFKYGKDIKEFNYKNLLWNKESEVN